MTQGSVAAASAFPIILVHPSKSTQKQKYASQEVRAHAARLSARQRDLNNCASRKWDCEERGHHSRPGQRRPSNPAQIQQTVHKCAPGAAVVACRRDTPKERIRRRGKQHPAEASSSEQVVEMSPPPPPLYFAVSEPHDSASPDTIIQAYTSILVPSARGYREAFYGQSPTVTGCPKVIFASASVFDAIGALTLLVQEDLQQRRQPHTLSSRPDCHRPVSRRVLTHASQAIQQLRKDLSEADHASDPTLVAIATLALIEEKQGNIALRNLHRRAVGNLVAQRAGGLDALRLDAKSWILNLEFAWALETGDTVFENLGHLCKLKRQDTAEENLSPSAVTSEQAEPQESKRNHQSKQHIGPQRETKVGITTLPPGFETLAYNLSDTILIAVHRIAKAQRQRRQGQPNRQRGAREDNSPTSEGNPTNLSNFQQTKPLVELDFPPAYISLFDACPDALKDSNNATIDSTESDHVAVNVLVCLGLLLYSYIALVDSEVWHSLVIWPIAHRVRNLLTEKLLLILSQTTPPATVKLSPPSRTSPEMSSSALWHEGMEGQDLLQWLTYLTIASWKTADNDLPSRCLDLAAAASRRFGCNDTCTDGLIEREAVLDRFFWSEKLDLDLVERSIRCYES